jgi:hypothetical protein
MGREVAFGFFDHDGKGLAHGKRRPDCLAMLLRVPGARPSLLLETSDDRANLHPLLLASALSSAVLKADHNRKNTESRQGLKGPRHGCEEQDRLVLMPVIPTGCHRRGRAQRPFNQGSARRRTGAG